MKTGMYTIVTCALAAVAGTFYGMAACKFQLFPYPDVRRWYESHLEPIPAEYLATPEHYTRTDVAGLISIQRPADIERKRQALITVLWGEPVLPDDLPSTVDRDFRDGRYDDIPELARIDRLTVSMEFGIESRAYHFVPETPNERLMIYHQGHRGDFHESKPQIRRFLEEGYTVAALAMPLLGLNNQPTVELPRLGHLTLSEHDNLRFLSPERGIPVQYFIEPVVVVLNHLAREFEPSNVAMTGISGGGWTTTLAAAVDERIRHSFPVAGSYPLYLRSRSARDWGDYEQNLPELYRTVNYPEMYVLGAHGEGRQQLQIINQFDRCCFAGTKWETYRDVVRNRVEELGAGRFDLFMDSSHHDHRFSDVAMRRILDELQHSEGE